MELLGGDWLYDEDRRLRCRVLEHVDAWGQTAVRVWYPEAQSIALVSPGQLKPIKDLRTTPHEIAAMLKEGELRSIAALARELGMATLVESHDPGEFALAGEIGSGLVGINNRDLHTFVTDTAVTEGLLAGYSGDAVIVTESGIDSPGDIRRLDAAGARAFLIGESLLSGATPGVKLVELINA